MTKSTGVGRGVGGGAPAKYQPSFCRIAKAMAKLGATEREIAQALDVSVATLQRWVHERPKFRAALKPGKQAADDRVERSLYQRATGYSFDSEEIFTYDYVETKKVEGTKGEVRLIQEKRVLRVPVVKHVPPDSTAIIFWLKNRRKLAWRNYVAAEISTPPGKPFEVKNNAPGEPELIGAYYARLARIAAASSEDDSPAGADPGSDPGVGEGGQRTHGQRGDPPPRKG